MWWRDPAKQSGSCVPSGLSLTVLRRISDDDDVVFKVRGVGKRGKDVSGLLFSQSSFRKDFLVPPPFSATYVL